MINTGNENTETHRQLAALEQFLSDSFFGRKDRRSVFGSGEFIRGQVTFVVEKIPDEGVDHYLVSMKNAAGEEVGFGLNEKMKVLNCDDGKKYPISDERIELIKFLAR